MMHWLYTGLGVLFVAAAMCVLTWSLRARGGHAGGRRPKLAELADPDSDESGWPSATRMLDGDRELPSCPDSPAELLGMQPPADPIEGDQ